MFSRRTVPVLIGICLLAGMFLMGQDTWGPAPECVVDADCDDGNVCTDDACVHGACVNVCNATGPADPCCEDPACAGEEGCHEESCLRPNADCTLAETAREAGFFVGAAVPEAADPRMASVPLHFNSITAENAMKWGSLCRLTGQCDFTRADALMEYAEANDLRVRGHTLVWGQIPGHGYPADLESLVEAAPAPYAFLRETIRAHVSVVVGRYAGRIDSWDVVNEPLNVVGRGLDDNIFHRTMGQNYIVEAFRAAHEADPDARLFLNEYFYVYNAAKADALLALLGNLIDEGVPIHGVGIQGHVYVTKPFRACLGSFLRRISDLGLDVELTEIDMAKIVFFFDLLLGRSLFDAQADVYETLVEACLGVPSCTGITTWGIDDSESWLDNLFPIELFAPNEPLLLDRNLAPKPAYDRVRKSIARAFGAGF